MLVSDNLDSSCSIPNGGGGTSGLFINEATHTLHGSATTIYYTLNSAPLGECSVNATMAGPGVSVTASSSGCNPTVDLASTAYQPSSTYCIGAGHSWPDGGCATSSCLISPGPKVTSVIYEQILTDDLGIDDNPNAGGGLRIFPDKKLPAETVDRRTIRVVAQYSSAAAGVRIYFRNFDVDDPSADTAPIDTNDTPTVKVGNDNNGNVDGTTATRAGVLVIPATGQPNPYNCIAFSNANASGVSCETDSNGVAKVDYKLTMQPGDNFSVAASPDETYVSSLVPTDDGINLKDTNDIQTPVTTTEYNACASQGNKACRTEMLTVWRRLHIEYDSMGNVTGNRFDGTFSSGGKIGQGNQTLSINTPPLLEANRFENGRIVIGN